MEQLTVGTFLTVVLTLAAIGVAFAIPMLLSLRSIESSVRPLRQIDERLRDYGIERLFERAIQSPPKQKPESESNPLTPEEELRRQELLDKAARFGLNDWEIEELQGLLRKKAQDDFAKGLIGALALIGLLAVIAAIADSLKKKEDE